ncbi:MAG: hypothetical protein U5L09_13770 [Bacteroidales bacterium]|nr:hypothetical protein [Bacteroidales bacterium]
MYLEYHNIFTPAMEFGVFSASTVLWLINLAIPAIIGTLFIFQLRFFKKNNGIMTDTLLLLASLALRPAHFISGTGLGAASVFSISDNRA